MLADAKFEYSSMRLQCTDECSHAAQAATWPTQAVTDQNMSSNGHLLAVGVCIRAALLLEGIKEAWLDLHSFADIVDHPYGQAFCCDDLQHSNMLTREQPHQ